MSGKVIMPFDVQDLKVLKSALRCKLQLLNESISFHERLSSLSPYLIELRSDHLATEHMLNRFNNAQKKAETPHVG